MIMQTIKFQSSLSKEEVMKIAEERAPQFRALPGLVQKYYVIGNQQGHFGGVYIWDSMESLISYRESELAASIPDAYKLIGSPDIEIHEVAFQLRR